MKLICYCSLLAKHTPKQKNISSIAHMQVVNDGNTENASESQPTTTNPRSSDGWIQMERSTSPAVPVHVQQHPQAGVTSQQQTISGWRQHYFGCIATAWHDLLAPSINSSTNF